MERKYGSSVTSYTEYNYKSEKLIDEECLLTLLLGAEMQEVIDIMITNRPHELEKANS